MERNGNGNKREREMGSKGNGLEKGSHRRRLCSERQTWLQRQPPRQTSDVVIITGKLVTTRRKRVIIAGKAEAKFTVGSRYRKRGRTDFVKEAGKGNCRESSQFSTPFSFVKTNKRIVSPPQFSFSILSTKHPLNFFIRNVSNHKLKGPLSSDIGKLDQLQFLDLHYNNFYGAIPPELGNCTELQGLFLQNNYFSGYIPTGLGNLSKLQTLDISSNSLDGNIPTSIGSLRNLVNFNVSSNFLAGPIPTVGALGQFGSDSFVGNSDLCGNQTNKLCEDDFGNQQPKGNHNEKKNSGRLLISASATVGALLLVALMCFWGCFLYKKLGKNDVKGLAKDVSGGASIVMFHGDLPYSSKDIIKKLETLNEEHVIGAGGFGTVYKLAMDDGNVFALKRIVKLNEGFDRFFERELAILGSIKHKYLVNLRGYCNSPTSKLLLYDYLPGGSLDEALHEKGEQLDWDARLNIIMGAAKGLAYLHHDCSPRIIHRDIKASNILLDGNLEARVSDFGLAKLLEDEESHITTIVAGTFGYLAPEYMQSGRATEKTDVYSFGVLMLEVISRKRPTDASFIEKGLNIVGWLNYLVTEDRQHEIIDGKCEGVEAETLNPLLSVAIQCVSSSPEDRPTMHTVVKTLESEVMTPCPSDFYDSSSD